MGTIVDEIKQTIKDKYGISVTDSLTPEAFGFVLSLPREPFFEIVGNSISGRFDLKITSIRKGDPQMHYSGNYLDSKGLMYMLSVQINYFRNLKE